MTGAREQCLVVANTVATLRVTLRRRICLLAKRVFLFHGAVGLLRVEMTFRVNLSPPSLNDFVTTISKTAVNMDAVKIKP